MNLFKWFPRWFRNLPLLTQLALIAAATFLGAYFMVHLPIDALQNFPHIVVIPIPLQGRKAK